MKVPFFNYPNVYKQYASKIKPKLFKALNNGSFILGRDLSVFEKNLAKFLSAKHAIGVADGTNALILCLRAAGIKKGDEVIISSHTYIATASSIHDAGGVPVIIDCKNDFMMDENKIEQAITKKTKFIMPTQLNGRVCCMNKIIQIAKKYKLKIIEDSAQAIGAKFGNRFSSTFGIAGTISFYPAKILGSFGDGGAIITNNSNFAKKILRLRDHGRNEIGKVWEWGTNSRLDNIQAVVLNEKLKFLKIDIDRRRQIANIYQKGLENNKNIILPPAPKKNNNNFDVFQNYEIIANNRNKLKKYLRKKGIGTLIQWNNQPLHSIKGINVRISSFKKTEEIYKKILMLPMNTALKTSQIKYIIKTINSFYDKKNK